MISKRKVDFRGILVEDSTSNVNSMVTNRTMPKCRFKCQMRGGNLQLISTSRQLVGHKQELNQTNIMTSPKYYNPDPLIHLTGRANDSEIEVNGEITTALTYLGTQVSIHRVQINVKLGDSKCSQLESC